ncbi:hypothetical protein AK812_SmicGene38735 [Symbiodinium microadriaticum]|uniref:Uncharacterized protein n=1 Tax=Symbiodinium microadriaticum TaxID=2951 RepID=A0A1Q9CD93_SYMMI|nr:hypothetical protein AK812_SmicGene38735 [Symbiodinium microadriaticum]
MTEIVKYCQIARDNFVRNNQGTDPSSLDDINSYTSSTEPPNLEEYRQINSEHINLRSSRTCHPASFLSLTGYEDKEILDGHYEIVRNRLAGVKPMGEFIEGSNPDSASLGVVVCNWGNMDRAPVPAGNPIKKLKPEKGFDYHPLIDMCFNNSAHITLVLEADALDCKCAVDVMRRYQNRGMLIKTPRDEPPAPSMFMGVKGDPTTDIALIHHFCSPIQCMDNQAPKSKAKSKAPFLEPEVEPQSRGDTRPRGSERDIERVDDHDLSQRQRQDEKRRLFLGIFSTDEEENDTDPEEPHPDTICITPKIAPAYDGTTSWFEYEQLIDDWCDITTLDESKRGYRIEAYSYPVVRQTMFDQTGTDGETNAEGVEADEDTLEEGFLAADDETVFWTIDDNEAFIARQDHMEEAQIRDQKVRFLKLQTHPNQIDSSFHQESLSSEGSDHASCTVTFVTGTGKIDFLELYGGGKQSPSVRPPPDVIMPDMEVSPSDPSAAPQQPGPILPVQEGDEESSEELVPDDPGQPSILPHSSGSPEPESDAESDDTRYYSDEEGDLVIDEKDWVLLTEEQKLCSNTGSFSMPRYMGGSPIDIREVTSRIRSDRTRYQPSRKNRSDIREEYDLLTEDDKALSVSPLKGLSNLSQKAQRKEATAKEKRELKKQFDEAKAAEYQSWLDNDVFELIDTRKLGNIRNYVTGRWVLTLKRDKGIHEIRGFYGDWSHSGAISCTKKIYERLRQIRRFRFLTPLKVKKEKKEKKPVAKTPSEELADGMSKELADEEDLIEERERIESRLRENQKHLNANASRNAAMKETQKEIMYVSRNGTLHQEDKEVLDGHYEIVRMLIKTPTDEPPAPSMFMGVKGDPTTDIVQIETSNTKTKRGREVAHDIERETSNQMHAYRDEEDEDDDSSNRPRKQLQQQQAFLSGLDMADKAVQMPYSWA